MHLHKHYCLVKKLLLPCIHSPLEDQNTSESFSTYDFPHIKGFKKIQSLKRHYFKNQKTYHLYIAICIAIWTRVCFHVHAHVCSIRLLIFNSNVALCTLQVVCKQKLMYLQLLSHLMKYSEPCLIDQGSGTEKQKAFVSTSSE